VETEDLIEIILKKESIVRWQALGWCRTWSDQVMDMLGGMPDIFTDIEAREVELSPAYWHTFVSAKTKEEGRYFFDVRGFVGKEDDAPPSLQGSRRDSLLMTEREIRYKSMSIPDRNVRFSAT